jgi:hypothetical protein
VVETHEIAGVDLITPICAQPNTQGQDAISRKYLSVIICTYELLSFYNTHVPLDAPFLLCMEHIHAKGSENQKCFFCESLLCFPQSAGKAEPQCEATPVDLGSPHFCGAWQYEFPNASLPTVSQ